MDYLNCNDQIVSSFFDLISIALASYQPEQGPDIQDIELLVEAVRVLRPQLVELETFDAMIQANRGFLDDAIKTLKHVVEVRNHFIYGKGLLAYYLFQRGDASWRALATEVLEHNQPEVVMKLMHAIERQDAFHSGSLSAEQLIELNHLYSANASANDAPQSPEGGIQTSATANVQAQAMGQTVGQTTGANTTQENYLRA